MDFEFTEEQERFRQEVRAFLELLCHSRHSKECLLEHVVRSSKVRKQPEYEALDKARIAQEEPLDEFGLLGIHLYSLTYT